MSDGRIGCRKQVKRASIVLGGNKLNKRTIVLGGTMLLVKQLLKKTDGVQIFP